jgi:chromosome segregation ATPase
MTSLSGEDRMGPVYRLNQPVKLIIVMGLIISLTGCTADLWNRISDLEQQMATMTADHRVLPQQIETLQLKIQTMDQEVRSRQNRVLTEIEHFRDEDLAHFTQRLDALAQNFQSFRKEMVNSAPWEQMHAEVADVQAALTRMKVSLDQVQLQHDQSHSPAAKRSASVPKPVPASESKAVSAAKAP